MSFGSPVLCADKCYDKPETDLGWTKDGVKDREILFCLQAMVCSDENDFKFPQVPPVVLGKP